MAKITFQLVQNSNEDVVKTSTALLDIWSFIKAAINEPRSYSVEELENGELVDSVCACYLIENYKDSEELPLTVSDIS